MIPVTPAVEPSDFDTKVRQPGAAFLKKTPCPSARDWKRHDYWRKASQDLLDAYDRICSYSGSWTISNVNKSDQWKKSSVDHFVPKSTDPNLAYDWSNYRLCRTRLNNRKGNHNDVLDPFTLADRWFIINFTTFLIRPNPILSCSDKDRVQKTLVRLELNHNDYVNERINVICGYCSGNYTLPMLDDRWPFIALEMRAQNFDTVFLDKMRVRCQTHQN